VALGLAPSLWAPALSTHAESSGARATADGLRTMLQQDGIDLQANYLSEAAANVAGGEARLAREAGQLTVGARLDAERLFAVRGGALQVTFTWRRGRNLVSDAGLDTLGLVQANYGRGQTARITELWYEQTISAARMDVKLGRMPIGNDFASAPCDFMNLTFCGSPPGSVVNDYWYNWPVSQWGLRWRYRGAHGYGQIGLYEANPRDLDESLNIGRLTGATGVLIPVEAGFGSTLGANKLPGRYKMGAWYDSSDADDVFLDLNGLPRGITGLEAAKRHGRYGMYAQLRQQLTGQSDGETETGLSAFFHFTRADRRTSRVDSQITAGLTYMDPLRRGARDQVGFAIGRTHLNSRSTAYNRLAEPTHPTLDSEYPVELFFKYQVTSWLTVQPNVQYISCPGGYAHRQDVVIVGVRTTLSL
jgi:porin